MSVFQNALRSVVSSPTLLQGFPSFGYGSLTQSANKVNVGSSLTLSAFYSGIDMIANSIAILPHAVIQKTDDTVSYLKNHPVQKLLNTRPNYHQSAFGFKHQIAANVLLRGNFFAGIVTNESGNKTALNFWDSNLVTVIDHENELYYEYKGKMNI